MKNIALLLFLGFALLGCNKDPKQPNPEDIPFAYDDANIKIVEMEGSTMPDQRYGFHFFDAQNGVCLTRLGDIYRTNDAGTSWKAVYKNPHTEVQALKSLIFLDSMNGFAAGGASGCIGTDCTPPGAILLKTTDAGRTWQAILVRDGQYDFLGITRNDYTGDLFILQNAFGPGQGQAGSILRSSDGGASWSSLPFKFGTSYYKIHFAQGKGYLIGGIGDANLLISNDNGTSWTEQKNFQGNWAGQVLANENTVYTLVDNTTIHRSFNDGNTFGLAYYSLSQGTNHIQTANFNSIVFRFGTAGYDDANSGFTEQSKAGLGYSLDQGTSWKSIQTNKNNSLLCSSFYLPKEGYACTPKKMFKILIK